MSSPWNDRLPTSTELGGVEYEIRSDYRAILDICEAIGDAELDDQEKAYVVLDIFYPAFEAMPPEIYVEALKWCMWFLNGGEDPEQTPAPKLIDWEQDFKHIVSPVNRVLGTEIRALEYLHWWTFLSAYQEIGDCLFAQIVRVRERLANNKPLDKAEREWYHQNKKLVDLKQSYSEAEDAFLAEWGIRLG